MYFQRWQGMEYSRVRFSSLGCLRCDPPTVRQAPKSWPRSEKRSREFCVVLLFAILNYMNVKGLRWSHVVFGVFVGCALFAIVFSLWYWAYVWLPQKESRAMQAHFKTVEKQWLLQQVEKAKLKEGSNERY